MFCARCGHDAGRATFCPACGTQVIAQTPSPGFATSAAQPAGRSGSTAVAAIGGVAVGVVVILLAAIVVIMLRNDGGGSEPERGSLVGNATPSQSASSSEPAATQAAEADDARQKHSGSDHKKQKQTPAGKAPKQTEDGPGDVRTLPAGLFCRDLYADGYSYSAAADYWRMHGQTNQMDEDRNGIPCETVYPSNDVSAYWGFYDVPTGSHSPGLFCRDLYARGVGYPEAVAYWFSEGAPDRMDADLNGIPCETVYSWTDVAAYWGSYEVPGSPYYEPGLFCRDLASRGATYAEAVAYWFAEGAPDRMDDDLNGVPCETVYPAAVVADYWY